MVAALPPVFFDAVAITGNGPLAAAASASQPVETIGDMDDWRKSLSLPLKDLKLADRQTLLLYRTCLAFLDTHPSFDRSRGAVHAAVGPARTDLEAMRRWSERAREEELWPMIQPAAAVGLLPNTPLSWVSIRLGLSGEPGVWNGFAEAGQAALMAGIQAILAGAPEAVAVAVNSTNNYFVQETLHRAYFPVPQPVIEAGAALRLHPSQGPGRLSGLAVFPAANGLSNLFSTLAEETGIDRNRLEKQAVIEGIDGRHDVSGRFGNPLTASFPLVLGLALQGAFSTGPVAFLFASPQQSICTAVVENA